MSLDSRTPSDGREESGNWEHVCATLQYDQENILGTPDYVAPEQALDSHGVDIRCDIYSLGATFYFLLTGQPPFAGGKVAQKLIRHQVAQPTAVRDLRAEVPRGVQAVLERMMAKNPAARYQTLAEAIADLSPMIVETVPPPSEDEMPTLSRAAASPPSMEFLAEPSSKVGQLPWRSSRAIPRPLIAPEPSGLVSTMNLASPRPPAGWPRRNSCPRPRRPGTPKSPFPRLPWLRRGFWSGPKRRSRVRVATGSICRSLWSPCCAASSAWPYPFGSCCRRAS